MGEGKGKAAYMWVLVGKEKEAQKADGTHVSLECAVCIGLAEVIVVPPHFSLPANQVLQVWSCQ